MVRLAADDVGVGIRDVAEPTLNPKFQKLLRSFEPNALEGHIFNPSHLGEPCSLGGQPEHGVTDDGISRPQNTAGAQRQRFEDPFRHLGSVCLLGKPSIELTTMQTFADHVAAQDYRTGSGSEIRRESAGEARFSRTGASSQGDQPSRGTIEQATRELEISGGNGASRVGIRSGRGRTCGETFDLGAYGGANRGEQWQQGQALVFQPRVDPGLKCGASRFLRASCRKVHDQKAQVVEHVGDGEIAIELQAVEWNGLAIQQHDVREVEITVAVPYEARCPARIERADSRGVRVFDPLDHPLDRRFLEDIRNEGSKIVRIAENHRSQGLSTSTITLRRKSVVEACHRLAETFGQPVIQSTTRGHDVEPRLGWKAHHFQKPLDDIAPATELEFTFGPEGHRNQPFVETGRSTAVEP